MRLPSPRSTNCAPHGSAAAAAGLVERPPRCRSAEQGRQSRSAGRSLVVDAGGSARSATGARLEAGRGDRTAAPARGRHRRRGQGNKGVAAAHVRGVFSGALKKKLGLAIVATKEERGRVYRIAEQPTTRANGAEGHRGDRGIA